MDELKVYSEEGPFGGIVERPAMCGPGNVEAAFNVALRDGEIEKRKGRVQLNGLFSATPALLAHDIGLTDFTVVTRDLTTGFNGAGNNDTVDVSSFGTSNTFYIGSPFPFSSFTMASNTLFPFTKNITLTAKYWNGSALVSKTPDSDGTAATNSGFTQTLTSGTVVVWSSGPATNWRPEQPILNGRRLPKMYYLRLTISAAFDTTRTFFDFALEMTNDNISSAGVLTQNGFSLLAPINGILFMQLPSGEKQILVGMDDTTGGNPRLFVYNWNRVPIFSTIAFNNGTNLASRGTFSSVLLPSVARTGVGAQWRGVPYGGKMILTNGFSPLMVYDGVSCEPLNALWGADSIQGTRSYSPAPSAKYVAVYNSALYACGITGAPRTVQMSETQNAFTVFTGSEQEQVGGANYWPVGQDFDVSTGDVSRPETSELTGIAVLGGNILILSRERGYLYNDMPLLSPLGGNTGCVAPNSLVSNGDVAFYLGDRAVWQVKADGSTEQIGIPINLTLTSALNTSAVQNAVGIISVANHEYRLFVPVGGDDRPTFCLVYDYQFKSWTMRGGKPPLVPNTLGGGAFDPYANLSNFVVTAIARVSEIGEPEVMISGDDKGHLWLEDEGDADGVLSSTASTSYSYMPIFAYVVSNRILKETPIYKQFRELFVYARKEGNSVLSALLCPNGEDALGALHSLLIEQRTSELVTASLSGDGLTPAIESEAWLSNNGIAPSGHNATVNGPALWGTREFRPFKFSFQSNSGNRSPRLAQSVQIVLSSRAAFSPFSIRAWKLVYRPAEDTYR